MYQQARKGFIYFITLRLISSLFSFVLHCSEKSDDGYQIGRGILANTRPAILYHVMTFVQ